MKDTNKRVSKSRILALLMTFIMVLSLMPAAAFAEETTVSENGGTEESNCIIIDSVEDLQAISKNLSANYKLADNIDLSGVENWTPIGSFYTENEDGETPDETYAFTGTFDGDGHTISNLTVNSPIGAGLFGCVAGGTVENLTVQDANVTGTCMVAAVIGYAYDSTVENVTLTASDNATNTVTGETIDHEAYGKVAPNMVAGIVGAGMDSTIRNCTVENTNLNVAGFSSADGWGTNVHDIGLLGGGLEGTSLYSCKAKNSAISITGPYTFGIGGLSGCAMEAKEVKDCSVSNVNIQLGEYAYLTGGLVGYSGQGDGKTALDNCEVTGVQITAGDASSRIGGMIGGGFYLPAELYRAYYPVPTSFNLTGTVSDVTITTGANSTALGLVAGQAYQSEISATGAGTVNGAASAPVCGTSEDKNTDFLYDLSETYQPLFDGATFETKYNHYWNEYAAAVVGEKAAVDNNAAGLMKSSIGASWANKGTNSSFCCAFTNSVATLSFQGSVITGYDESGNTVFSHSYKYLREGHLYGPGEDGSQVAYMDVTIFESLDGNEDEFKYFAMCGDTPSTTYHIEFRYGSNLNDLEQMYSGAYAYWLAAGIPTSAVSDESEAMISNVIALFCAENLAEMVTDETTSQREALAGTWMPEDVKGDNLVFGADGSVNGKAEDVFYAYNGKLITVVDDVCQTYQYTISGDASNDTLTITPVGSDESKTYTKWDGYYTVSVRDTITGGTVAVTGESKVKPGETVTFTAVPEDEKTTTSVGYWTIARDGKEGKLVTLKANEDGTYSFTMPDSNVGIGAAFQSAPVISDGSGSSSGQIGLSKETDWYLYASNEKAYLPTENAQPTARLFADERLLEQEDTTMTLETREYTSAGYKVVGTQEYDHDAMLAYFRNAEEGTTTYNKNTVTYKCLRDAEFPTVASLTAGNKVYMVAKFGRPEWVNAKGEPVYRWTSTEDSTVAADLTKTPQPIVWLYNLTEDSHRGAIVRSILNNLGITIGTIDGTTLDENIGYLVGWDGYDSTEPAYNTKNYDVEYILMGNLSEAQMDDFLNGMSEQNIRVNLKSVPTAWTAGKTFSELFDIMAKEDEAFKAVLELDSMIYDAEQLDEATYSKNPGWDDFKKALQAAKATLENEEELEAKDYLDACEKLKQAYLTVTKQVALDGDLALSIEKQEDGTYNISAALENGPENADFSYKWQNDSTGKVLTGWSVDALRQVKLTIMGQNGFYGTLSATLSVPSDPTYHVSANKNTVSVRVDAVPETRNMPTPIKYVIQLYQNNTLIGEQRDVDAGSYSFSNLDKNTVYTVKLYALNAVGQGNTLTTDVKTKSGSGSSGSSGSSGGTSSKSDSSADVPKQENPTTEQPTTEQPTTEQPAKEDTKQTVIQMQIGSKTMFVNGVAAEKDAAPVIRNDRTLVPIRFITESLGGEVAWNEATKEITLTIDGKEIKMTIGKTLEKYGVAPVIIGDRTYVPVRFVADELGAATAWNDAAKTVTITK